MFLLSMALPLENWYVLHEPIKYWLAFLTLRDQGGRVL